MCMYRGSTAVDLREATHFPLLGIDTLRRYISSLINRGFLPSFQPYGFISSHQFTIIATLRYTPLINNSNKHYPS